MSIWDRGVYMLMKAYEQESAHNHAFNSSTAAVYESTIEELKHMRNKVYEQVCEKQDYSDNCPACQEKKASMPEEYNEMFDENFGKLYVSSSNPSSNSEDESQSLGPLCTDCKHNQGYGSHEEYAEQIFHPNNAGGCSECARLIESERGLRSNNLGEFNQLINPSGYEEQAPPINYPIAGIEDIDRMFDEEFGKWACSSEEEIFEAIGSEGESYSG